MAFTAIEDSKDNAQPIALFEFAINDKKWRYTTHPVEIIALGATWEPCNILDDGIRQKGDPASDIVQITVPNDLEIIIPYRRTPPSSPMIVTVRRMHVGDADITVGYVGEVADIDARDPAATIISCSTLSASLDRAGLRLSYSRTCPYSLYDKQCTVTPQSKVTAGVISRVAEGVVTVPVAAGLSDGWFSGGYIEWEDDIVGRDRRAIEDNLAGDILIFGNADGLYTGLEVKLYPGCDRTTLTCLNKFDNMANYGGIPSMPSKSPFDGDPVF